MATRFGQSSGSRDPRDLDERLVQADMRIQPEIRKRSPHRLALNRCPVRPRARAPCRAAPQKPATVLWPPNGARAGDLAQASLVSSTRFIELDAAVWSNNTVRVMARNVSASTVDLAAAALSVGVVKRRVP